MAWFNNLELGPFLGAGCFGYVFKTFSSPALSSDSSSTTTTTTALKIVLQDSHLKVEKTRNDFDVAQLLNANHTNVVPILNVVNKTFSISDLEKLLNQIPSDYEGRPVEELTMLKYRAFRYKATISGVCIQMQLCGPTLRQWLNDPVQRRLAPSHLYPLQVDIVSGLVEGLRYLHSKDIIHNNVRPEVILFSEPNFKSDYRTPIKLGGFGHCCTTTTTVAGIHSSSSTSTTHIRLDSIYRSPEQDLFGGGAVTTNSPSADLFSLGLIMWEVLQILKLSHVRNLFYQLVDVGNVNLVEDHESIVNAKDLIVGLTKRRVVERMQSMSQVELVIRKSSPPSSSTTTDTVLTLCTNNSTSHDDKCWLETLQVSRLLGHGAFGTVLESPTNNTAVKVIFLGDEGANNNNKVHRVTREYFVPVGKDHQNVIKIIRFTVYKFTPKQLLSIFQSIDEVNNNDSFMDTIQYRVDRAQAKHWLIPTFCLEMELCGENLRSWLQSLDQEDIDESTMMMMTLAETQFQIATQLVEGLEFLHSHDIIHRDLKPENILFSSSGYTLPIKIGDFGLVRYLPGSSEYLTPNVGTSLYRAPEVGTDSYGHPADIFSLGLILWEVFQRLDRGSRKCLFFKLVHEYDPVQDADLVQNHSLVENVPQLIQKMTQRLVKDRIKHLKEVIIVKRCVDNQ